LIGCVENDSKLTAIFNNDSSSDSIALIAETFGRPSVNVPVLSKAKADNVPKTSKWLQPLIRTTFFAALPIAVTIATGVEIHSDHGQAITISSCPLYNQI